MERPDRHLLMRSVAYTEAPSEGLDGDGNEGVPEKMGVVLRPS